MKTSRQPGRICLLALQGFALTFTPAAMHAQTAWDGGAGNTDYSNNLNWAGDVIPGDGNTNGALIGNSLNQTVIYNTATSYTSTGTAKVNSLLVGTGTAGVGSLTLNGSAGTLTFGGDGYNNAAWIGSGSNTAATGTVTVTAGKLAITSGTDASINLGVQIGGTGIKNGTLTIDGGTVEVGRRILMGANATNTVGNLTISSGGLLNMKATGSSAEGDLGMIRLGSGTNTLNFDGGELIGRGVHQSGASATSNIYYNGTKFTLNGNSGTEASGLIGSGGTASNQIKNGGLKIDTAGFNATIARGLANFTGHTGVLTKEGAGSLTMAAGGSTYSQTVVNGGVLDLTANDVFGNHTSSVHSLTVNAGASVTNSTAAGGFNTFQSLTLNGGVLQATNTLSALSGTFQAYHLRGTVTVGGSTASTISDVGQANGAINIGGTTDLGGGIGANVVFAVANATSSPAADLTVSAKLKNSANSAFAALQTGIDKTGTGTVALTRVNSYTGATNIQQGTLALVSAGSIATSTVINVSAGATFDVTATSSAWSLATGQSLVGNGGIAGDASITGTVGPGVGLGTLSFADDLTLAGIASFEISAALSDTDLITVAAALAFGGTLNVTNLGGTLVSGQTFNLLDFDFAQSSGTFATVNLPSLDSGLSWNNSALYTTGVIAVVPEPGTPALLASFAAVLALRRRRK